MQIAVDCIGIFWNSYKSWRRSPRGRFLTGFPRGGARGCPTRIDTKVSFTTRTTRIRVSDIAWSFASPDFSRGYTIALLLLVAIKENGFLQVKCDRRFITTDPLRRRGVTTVEQMQDRLQVWNDLFLYLEIQCLQTLFSKGRRLRFIHRFS